MKRLFFGIFLGGLVFSFSSVHAEAIQGLKVSIAEKYALVEWTPLSDQVLSETDGYALQISSSEEKMRNVDTSGKLLFIRDSESSLSLFWPTLFKRGEYYYIRIYTYEKEGRSLTLDKGSKIKKIRMASIGEEFAEDPETLEPNDPAISNSVANAGFDFGKLSVKNPLDTQVDFFWSRPKNMSDSDFDKFLIVVSKEASLAHPVIKASAGRNATSMQLQGLEPSTTYYAKGYFAKGETQEFGVSTLETFSTVAPLTSDQKSRLSRLLLRGILTRPDIAVKIGQSTTTEEPVTTTTTTPTTSSSSSNTTTSTTSTSSASGDYTRAQIQEKIKEIKAELQTWEQRLQKLSPSSSRQTTSSTRSPRVSPPIRTNPARNTGKSIRQIICEKLGRTNCK